MGKLKLSLICVLLFLVVAIDSRMFLMSLLADAVLVMGIIAVYKYWPDKKET